MVQWHDGWEDDPDAGPDDDEDADDLDACPRCGRQIYADAERCPRCGQYITNEERPATTGQPLWVKVGALVCLAIILWQVWGAF